MKNLRTEIEIMIRKITKSYSSRENELQLYYEYSLSKKLKKYLTKTKDKKERESFIVFFISEWIELNKKRNKTNKTFYNINNVKKNKLPLILLTKDLYLFDILVYTFLKNISKKEIYNVLSKEILLLFNMLKHLNIDRDSNLFNYSLNSKISYSFTLLEKEENIKRIKELGYNSSTLLTLLFSFKNRKNLLNIYFKAHSFDGYLKEFNDKIKFHNILITDKTISFLNKIRPIRNINIRIEIMKQFKDNVNQLPINPYDFLLKNEEITFEMLLNIPDLIIKNPSILKKGKMSDPETIILNLYY